MLRRQLLMGFGGAVAAWPLGARAQQPAMPLVGVMIAGAAEPLRQATAGFRQGLKETGYVEGQNVSIDYRFAEGQFDRFPTFASELVSRQAAVLFTTSSAGTHAAIQATKTIPIVFAIGEDPIRLGFVASLNRPGGNVTGIYQFTAGLEAKRFGLLHEVVPNSTIMAVLINPNFSAAESQLRDVQEAAVRLGVQLVVLRANGENDFDAAFSTLIQQRAEGLLVCGSPFFFSKRAQLIGLAARHGVPAMYEWREYAATGGLMSYGTNLADIYRQGGLYSGQILAGAKPADLPVMQATKFEFVINLGSAKALGIAVPPALSARADEVIE